MGRYKNNGRGREHQAAANICARYHGTYLLNQFRFQHSQSSYTVTMSLLTWSIDAASLGCETTVSIALPSVKNTLAKDVPQDDRRPVALSPAQAAARLDQRRLPGTCYLLHGLTGDHSAWVRYGDVERLADRYNLAIIMPSGGRSFWVDESHGLAYFTWLTAELPALINSHLQVDTGRARTFIAGLSMGGYGAFLAALKHPEKYSAAGAFSGTLAIDEDAFQGRHEDAFADSFSADIATAGQDLLVLLEHNATRQQADQIFPRLWASCGTEDRLLTQNRRFVAAAKKYGYDLCYREGPGAHEWGRWNPDLADFLAAVAVPE